MTAPKHIEPGTRIPFRLSARERDVVLTRAFLEPEIESRLREATAAGEQLVVDRPGSADGARLTKPPSRTNVRISSPARCRLVGHGSICTGRSPPP